MTSPGLTNTETRGALAPEPALVPLANAVALFAKLCRIKSLGALLRSPPGYVRCWTPSITVMAMIMGPLMGRATLEKILALMGTGVADCLCEGSKKLSALLHGCASTSALAQARARLPLGWLRRCLWSQAAGLRSLADGWRWNGCEVRVLDGTMITLRPMGRIPRRFPAHSNQHGECYWCQMRVLACMCLGTGVILALITGHAADSEEAQCVRLLLFGTSGLTPPAPASILWMGDANFGVWRVVAASRQSHQLVLVRLTSTRARKLAGTRELSSGQDLTVSWSPSPNDGVDRGLKATAVTGRLIVHRLERRGYRSVDLFLFTTVEATAATQATQLAALYLKRWKIELTLRHFKSQMGIGELTARSPAMARRELITGALAYNLVRGVMLLAGAIYGGVLLPLSFAKAREELTCAVSKASRVEGSTAGSATAEDHWLGMLQRIVRGKLPRRSKPRPSEPRLKRHRRETFPPLKGDRSLARKVVMLANLKGR